MSLFFPLFFSLVPIFRFGEFRNVVVHHSEVKSGSQEYYIPGLESLGYFSVEM